MPEDPRLARVTAICLALPETGREICNGHGIFRVKKKVFAYYLANHHGDGIVSVACKILPGDNTRLVAADPKRYYLPAYVGPRGWVALRLDVGKPNWSVVAELVKTSYGLMAPKRLAASIR